jgi:plastocyanin
MRLSIVAKILGLLVVAHASPAATTPAAPPPAKGDISGMVSSMPASSAKFAVVYLQNGPAEPAVDATVNNRQMNFIPEITVVTVGGKVKFTNSDPFPHNVFSPDHEKFDIGQIPQHGAKSRAFTKEGTYTLLCNLHPNMKGYLIVVPSMYFAKADAKGHFTIKDVPAGAYQVMAWAPHVKAGTQSVTVNGNVTVNFDLHR